MLKRIVHPRELVLGEAIHGALELLQVQNLLGDVVGLP